MSLRFTQSEIDREIAKLKDLPGVTVDRVVYNKLFRMVLVYGTMVKDNGIKSGVIAYFKKMEG